VDRFDADTGLSIENATIADNTEGASIDASRRATLTEANVTNATRGVEVSGSEDVTVNATAITADERGLFAHQTPGFAVTGTTVDAAGGSTAAIDVAEAPDAELVDNTVPAPPGTGVRVVAADGVHVPNTTVREAGGHGIAVSNGTDGATVHANDLSGAERDGIHVENMEDASLREPVDRPRGRRRRDPALERDRARREQGRRERVRDNEATGDDVGVYVQRFTDAVAADNTVRDAERLGLDSGAWTTFR